MRQASPCMPLVRIVYPFRRTAGETMGSLEHRRSETTAEPLERQAATASALDAPHMTEQAQALRVLLASSIRSEESVAEEDAQVVRSQLAELSRRFVMLDRRLISHSRRTEELRTLKDVPESAGQELERLLAVRGVRTAEVAGSQLRVTTHPLGLESGGSTYNLGEYRILLDLAGDVRIESISRLGPKPHWDHPHIQDALPCLGNLREGVLKLIARYELALAMQVLMDFLSTYNADTAYCPIEGWPR